MTWQGAAYAQLPMPMMKQRTIATMMTAMTVPAGPGGKKSRCKSLAIVVRWSLVDTGGKRLYNLYVVYALFRITPQSPMHACYTRNYCSYSSKSCRANTYLPASGRSKAPSHTRNSANPHRVLNPESQSLSIESPLSGPNMFQGLYSSLA